MNLDDRSFTTSALTAAAGCEPMTFRTWRNRNGLFPEVSGGRTWKRFTVVDVCVARAVAMMTSHGIAVGNAIAFAQNNLRSEIEDLLTGERSSSLVGFFVGGTKSDDLIAYTDESGNGQIVKQSERPEPPASFVFLEDAATLMETVAKTKGILTIIDLKALAQHVVDVLEKRDPGNA